MVFSTDECLEVYHFPISERETCLQMEISLINRNVSYKLEKEMAIHSRVLAWRIPGTGEPGGLPSVGSHRIQYD